MLAFNCIEKEVQFAGVLPGIPVNLDPSCRSEVLRIIDQAKQENRLMLDSRFLVDVTLHIDVNNLKLISVDNRQEPLLRIPIPQVAAVSYIRDDDQHILCVKFGEVSKTRPSDKPSSCSLAVMYCDSRVSAEEICSCVDLCFQIIYTDATMTFFDKSLIEECQNGGPDDTFSGAVNKNALLTNLTQLSPHHGSLGFLSHSSLSLGNSGSTSSASAISQMTHRNSETELSSAANELILDYMNKLYTKLAASELQEFAMLIRSWHTDMTFSEFCQKVLNLYGSERRHLLVGMRPFIPAKDLSYFEQFLQKSGCSNDDDDLLVTAQLSDQSWTVLGQHRHWHNSFASLTNSFEMVDRCSPTNDDVGSNASLDMS